MAFEHTFMGKNGITTKFLTPMGAIRQKCLECSNWSAPEVRLCAVHDCALYPFRAGKKPGHIKREISPEKKAKLAEQLKRAREAHKKNRLTY